jgi:glycogen(starch) synthase
MNKPLHQNTILIESSWEVCNQVGGIYTVIRSKLPATMRKWNQQYCLVGPLVNTQLDAEFEDISPDNVDPICKAVNHLRGMGWEVRYGYWLVTGRPRVVLLNPANTFSRLQAIKTGMLREHGIPQKNDDPLFDQCIQWGEMVKAFLKVLAAAAGKTNVIAHFHEWMAATPMLGIHSEKIPVKTVFTTHATMLGRVLAMNENEYQDKLPYFDEQVEAKRFHLESIHGIEKAAAALADVFTTVSEVTADECFFLLKRRPHIITLNGLNLARFAANHEVQIRHESFKEKIHQFVIGHFFNAYSFDLDDTLYFFTSGRYEYHNKGFDITIEALKMLNEKMLKGKVPTTVVMFFITKANTWSINPEVLQNRAVLEEIRNNCEAIQNQIGKKLFYAAAASTGEYKLPALNDLVDDYWKLRYRRTIQSWKHDKWPIIVTHNLVNDVDDQILQGLRDAPLVNSPLDKVKVVYHPDFIASTNPLFSMDYGQFVRGCHLGIFPSYYEPYGYTPLECIARGVPAVTSDLSGFGHYVDSLDTHADESGVYVLHRKNREPKKVAEDLANYLFHFVKTTRRYRMIMRNKLEDFAENFEWERLTLAYDEAYQLALKNKKPM